MSASGVVLEDDVARAEVVPHQGARVRSLQDLRTGRELLYRRPLERWNPDDYLATLDGGWDQMFPNDDPWDGRPVHGTVWSSRMSVVEATPTHASLSVLLDDPSVRIDHRYQLLDPPRRGLRLRTTVTALGDVRPGLWATHPMLAVEPGWCLDVGEVDLDADPADPGRVPPGRIPRNALPSVLRVPAPNQGWQEVLYGRATGRAAVQSTDGSSRTCITWDTAFFRHVWLVTLSGFAGVDLAVVIEPSTTRPYRLDEAIRDGTTIALARGDRRSFWSEVESEDRTHLEA